MDSYSSVFTHKQAYGLYAWISCLPGVIQITNEVESIIQIALVKIGFSYLFSTSVAEVVQTKNTVKVGSKSLRTEVITLAL